MTFSYRIAQIKDTTTCVKILRDWNEETLWMPALPYSTESMEIFWREVIEDDEAWVACSNGRIIGFCTRNDENIGALYVAPEMRGFNVGKHLLDLARSSCIEIVVWAFEANERARSFYNREGFVESGREIDEETNLMNIEHRWLKSSTDKL